MAHAHLEKEPVAVQLANELADGVLAPVAALIPAQAAEYLRERIENLCYLHPVVSTVFARVVKARLAALRTDDDLPLAARKPERPPKPKVTPANDALPPTPEELARARRDTLVLGAKPTILGLAKRYAKAGVGSVDDLVQEGNVVALLIAEKFDDGRKVQFSTFVYRAVEARFITLARKATVIRRRTARDFSVEIDSSKPTPDDEGALRAHAAPSRDLGAPRARRRSLRRPRGSRRARRARSRVRGRDERAPRRGAGVHPDVLRAGLPDGRDRQGARVGERADGAAAARGDPGSLACAPARVGAAPFTRAGVSARATRGSRRSARLELGGRARSAGGR